jgi:putative Mg2+ transporter-C (MgtC) family protein
MIFTYISALVDPNPTSMIAAQIVTGIRFLGSGITLKSELFHNKELDGPIKKNTINLTTAANIWFSGAMDIAIGFSVYLLQ